MTSPVDEELSDTIAAIIDECCNEARNGHYIARAVLAHLAATGRLTEANHALAIVRNMEAAQREWNDKNYAKSDPTGVQLRQERLYSLIEVRQALEASLPPTDPPEGKVERGPDRRKPTL